MKKTKTQKGITLVALIITIVVLLILAAVAIGAVRDSNIIGHTQNAATRFNQAKDNETSLLAQYENTILKNISSGQTEEILWGEWSGMLFYIGDSTNLTVTSDTIQVEEGTMDTNDFSFTRNGTIKQADINNYTNVYFIVNNTIQTINFGNILESNNKLAFNMSANLKEIRGLEGITAFDYQAFTGCTALETIVLPETLTKMPYFSGCTSLKNVNIPTNENITSLEDVVFSDCTSLENITIPDNITSICNQAFENCTSLTSITIPNTVTSIAGSAFNGCTSLTEVTINKTKAEVEAEGGIGTAWIPESVTKIIYSDQTVDLTQNT